MTNREILDIYLKDGTIRTCVECQFSKMDRMNKIHKNELRWDYMEDFFNDMVVLILEYDNEKLNDVHNNNHFNAWLTRIIENNLFSTTSKFYRTYKRYDVKNADIKTVENFEYNTTPTEDDDDTMIAIKTAISKMKRMEQRLWFDYIDVGTYAALARKYNVSAPTAKTYIMSLKKKIMDEIKQQENITNLKINTIKYTTDEHIPNNVFDSFNCDPNK